MYAYPFCSEPRPAHIRISIPRSLGVQPNTITAEAGSRVAEYPPLTIWDSKILFRSLLTLPEATNAPLKEINVSSREYNSPCALYTNLEATTFPFRDMVVLLRHVELISFKFLPSPFGLRE